MNTLRSPPVPEPALPHRASPAPLRVVLLNDVGFVGGAGVALRRQAQSFLLAGHDVAVLCWLETPGAEPLPPRGGAFPGRWRGLHARPEIHADHLGDGPALAWAICEATLALAPDVVVAGNLHWARWPLAALEAIRAAGVPVVAYLHDCHWLTGRCAYFGSCRRFETQCDAACPTPSEYPALDPALIAGAQADRRRVFAGDNPLPMAANSRWTLDVARRAHGPGARVALLPLGLDMRLFAPIDRALARRLLDLPEDAFVVLTGAVDLAEPRKGGPLLRGVLDALAQSGTCMVVGFGHNSEYIRGLRGLGAITDERVMPVVCSAADLIVSCASEESFGQSILEGSACGRPALALATGGIPDIVRSGETGILLPEPDPERFVAEILAFSKDRSRLESFGAAARRHVEGLFSLEAQGARWQAYLADLLTRAPAKGCR